MRCKALILVFVVAQSLSTHAQSRVNVKLPDENPFALMLPVDFCEVTRNPNRYDGKTIRLRTIYTRHFESGGLLPYDSKDCRLWIRVAGYECPDAAACLDLLQRLQPPPDEPLRITSLPVLLSGRFRYRRYLTAEEAKFGFHFLELIVTGFEGVLEPPQNPNAEPIRP